MKNTLFICLLTLLFSCEKENKECETLSSGTLEITNNTSDRYDLYLNTSYHSTLQQGSSNSLTLSSITPHNIWVIQKEGFIIFPTEYQTTVSITSCETTNWAF